MPLHTAALYNTAAVDSNEYSLLCNTSSGSITRAVQEASAMRDQVLLLASSSGYDTSNSIRWVACCTGNIVFERAINMKEKAISAKSQIINR
jgi:hypothetical protein